MSSYIVKTERGYFLLVAGAVDSLEAMNTARTHAPHFGIPIEVRLTSADAWEPEPAIALYLSVAR
jgi:phosphoribosylcarboxyaminoimidazole (NCAIR) mutase